MKSLKIMLCGITLILLGNFMLSIDVTDVGMNSDIAFVTCVIGILTFTVGLILNASPTEKGESKRFNINMTCPKCGAKRNIKSTSCENCNFEYASTLNTEDN